MVAGATNPRAGILKPRGRKSSPREEVISSGSQDEGAVRCGNGEAAG